MQHFGDRLSRAIREKNAPVCVGLDPLLDRLPPSLGTAKVTDAASAARVLLDFGRGVIDAVAPLVPVLKINIAFFERYRADGFRAYHELVREARSAGLIVIGDVKRADIGHTSAQYAAGQLGGDPLMPDDDLPDAITVNPYFGWDGVWPFIEAARESGRGVFVLVQTSNASAEAVQGIPGPAGLSMCQHVAQLVEGWATTDGLVGESGYSSVGAVVSPRDVPSTIRIREMMPHCFFLVPGFGAQGRSAEEVVRCFQSGGGAIVAASRSVIFAHEDRKWTPAARDWKDAVHAACKEFIETVRSAL